MHGAKIKNCLFAKKIRIRLQDSIQLIQHIFWFILYEYNRNNNNLSYYIEIFF